MKKITAILVAVLMLTACGDAPDNLKSSGDRADVLRIQEDCIINEPKAEGYYTLELKACAPSDKAAVDVFYEYYDMYFSDVFTPEEKGYQCRFVSDELPASEAEYPDCLPKISDHYSELKAGSLKATSFMLDTPKGELDYRSPGFLHILNRGLTYKLEKQDKYIGMYFPDNLHPRTAEYLDPQSEEKCILPDGEISIGDAVSSAEKLIAETCVSKAKVFEPSVAQVSVTDLGGQNGLAMQFGKKYKGIPFDCAETDSSGVFSGDAYSNGKSYNNMPAYAFLWDSKTLDIMIGYGDSFSCTEKEKHESILSLDEAKKTVCKKFSDYNGLTAYKIELVYISEERSADPVEYFVQPAWKFSINDSHGQRLWVYVNAVTEECFYQSAGHKQKLLISEE
ncbi:hypothetical protein SAMN02910317_01806 [Ruminococcaceae bacterium FB2012]|nr:hypothetical protein SAMN02910317_01806 [Ruminococcaceae bacterium FB2012]